jgi:8-oxo-dGTP diphosphatase
LNDELEGRADVTKPVSPTIASIAGASPASASPTGASASSASPARAARATLEVAVGVVFREDGAVLFGQRLPGKPYAGWWEFPGGKLEAGESVEQALARELHEELGLTVTESVPWVVREFDYPHAYVRLHFQRVTRYLGVPQSREGQQLSWQQVGELSVTPILPAALPVIEWLALPMQIQCITADALAQNPPLQKPPLASPDAMRLLRSDDEVANTGVLFKQNALDGQIWSRQRLQDRRVLNELLIQAVICSKQADIDRAAELNFDLVIADRSLSAAARKALARTTRLPLFVFESDLALARAAGAHGIVRLA